MTKTLMPGTNEDLLTKPGLVQTCEGYQVFLIGNEY